MDQAVVTTDLEQAMVDTDKCLREGLGRLQRADELEVRLRHGQIMSTTDVVDGEQHVSMLAGDAAIRHLEHLRQTSAAYIQAGLAAALLEALASMAEEIADGD